MANDRLFVRCKHCGATEIVSKYYPSQGVQMGVAASAFMAKHLNECAPEIRDCNLDMGEDVFAPFEFLGESGFRRGDRQIPHWLKPGDLPHERME